MLPVVLWMLGIAISVPALVLSAAARPVNLQLAYAHMAIAAAMSLVFAAMAIRECRAMLGAGAAPSEVASNNARCMGVVWAWGALALIMTYGTGALAWKEWWHFVIVFTVAAATCFLFAATLKMSARSGQEDETMLRWARYLAMIQLVGMIVVMVGLLIDGKMVRFLNPRHTDWAANNVFFFGALALAAISGYALKTNKQA
jgi:hypothetical protein